MNDDRADLGDVVVYQFINYAMKCIRHSLQNHGRGDAPYNEYEILPSDGDLCDAPSMARWLNGCVMQEASFFELSQGSGDPMRIENEELALALADLPSKERDTLIKIFQHEIPMHAYAAQEGISTSMAYRRVGKILDRL